MPRKRKPKLVLGKDYVLEDGRLVLTRDYLLTLGTCCGKECRHRPYDHAGAAAPPPLTPKSDRSPE